MVAAEEPSAFALQTAVAEPSGRSHLPSAPTEAKHGSDTTVDHYFQEIVLMWSTVREELGDLKAMVRQMEVSGLPAVKMLSLCTTRDSLAMSKTELSSTAEDLSDSRVSVPSDKALPSDVPLAAENDVGSLILPLSDPSKLPVGASGGPERPLDATHVQATSLVVNEAQTSSLCSKATQNSRSGISTKRRQEPCTSEEKTCRPESPSSGRIFSSRQGALAMVGARPTSARVQPHAAVVDDLGTQTPQSEDYDYTTGSDSMSTLGRLPGVPGSISCTSVSSVASPSAGPRLSRLDSVSANPESELVRTAARRRVERQSLEPVPRDGSVILNGALEAWFARVSLYVHRLASADTPGNSLFARFVRSNLFESICTIAIIVNAGFIGYAAEYAINHIEEPQSQTIDAVNWFFTLFYFLEISVRIFHYRVMFFINADWKWNVFDLFLVCTSIYSKMSSALSNSGPGSSSNILRLLRLFKMLKMLRMIRVLRFFRELRLMLMPMIRSFRSFFFSMCMLLVIMYVFGLTFLQAAASTLVDASRSDDSLLDETLHDDLHSFFGSVGTSMQTLYFVVLGFNDATRIAASLKEGPGMIYFLIFLFFISFLTFAVFNIVVGIFVDTAMCYAEEDKNNVELDEGTQDSYVDMVADIMNCLDVDSSGTISYKEFAMSVGEWGVKTFLERHDITPKEAKVLFWRLSADGTTDVTVSDFVHVFTRMKGFAKSVDVQAIGFDQKRSSRAFQQFVDTCLKRLEVMDEKLDAHLLPQAVPARDVQVELEELV